MTVAGEAGATEGRAVEQIGDYGVRYRIVAGMLLVPDRESRGRIVLLCVTVLNSEHRGRMCKTVLKSVTLIVPPFLERTSSGYRHQSHAAMPLTATGAWP
jgi:hypothetical protein